MVIDKLIATYMQVYEEWKDFIHEDIGHLSTYDREKINESFVEILSNLSYSIRDIIKYGESEV